MSCIAEAFQTNSFFLSSQPTKLIKTKNVDLELRCSLLSKHDAFNVNSTVYWFKKSFKVLQADEDEWSEIECSNNNRCRLSLILNDETFSTSSYYMCKMFPYQTNPQSVLHIEVVKTFFVEKIGEIHELLIK